MMSFNADCQLISLVVLVFCDVSSKFDVSNKFENRLVIDDVALVVEYIANIRATAEIDVPAIENPIVVFFSFTESMMPTMPIKRPITLRGIPNKPTKGTQATKKASTPKLKEEMPKPKQE